MRVASLCASAAADRLSRSAAARSRPADVAAASSCAAARAARRRAASAASSASACSSSSRRREGRPLSYGGSSYGSASPSYRSCAHASRARGGDPPRGCKAQKEAASQTGLALRPLRASCAAFAPSWQSRRCIARPCRSAARRRRRRRAADARTAPPCAAAPCAIAKPGQPGVRLSKPQRAHSQCARGAYAATASGGTAAAAAAASSRAQRSATPELAPPSAPPPSSRCRGATARRPGRGASASPLSSRPAPLDAS